MTIPAAIPACTPDTPPAETADGVTEGTTAGDTADGQITLSVSKGDEIAFVINKHKLNAYAAATAEVSVAYK